MNYPRSTVRTDKLIRYQGEQIAKMIGYRPEQLYNKKRKNELCLIRGVMMYRLRWSCGFTVREVGEVFNMHHSSCCYWCQKVNDMESINDELTLRLLKHIKL
jgi:chromosomal replication initiation ATPase DnaA